MIVSGLPRSARICVARACTSGERASCSKPAESIEIGNGFAITRRAGVVVGRRNLDERAAGRVPEKATHRAREVAGIRDPLEADHVGAEQPEDDLVAPRQLGEDPVCRERDVIEEPDGQVRALLAQHAGHELQLVVLHPDRRARARSPAIAASANRWLTST